MRISDWSSDVCSSDLRIDMADLAGDGATEYAARLQAALRDPMFTDLDLPKLQSEDVATNFPGMTEAFLRLYTAYQEEQLAIADRDAQPPRGGDGNARRTDAVAEEVGRASGSERVWSAG